MWGPKTHDNNGIFLPLRLETIQPLKWQFKHQ
jgi:hypothetical protein